jgi:allantoin racemase
MERKMRLLIINPNTTNMVTERVTHLAQAMAPPDVEIIGATGRFGARYISTRAASAIAGHATLDAYAEYGAGVDGVLLACFGDPGLLALRELADCPVTGLAEAACHAACQLGKRFSIITGGARWKPMLEEFITQLGLTNRLASIRAVAPTGGEIAANPAAAHALLAEAAQAAVREDGAEVVILGGAGLVGIRAHIADRVPVPLLCSVEVGIRTAFASLFAEYAKPVAGSFALPEPIGTIGLTPALAARLEGTRP